MIVGKKGRTHQFNNSQTDLEANLALEIAKTGKEQIKRRQKAGLSVYYMKDGRLVEQMPDKTEVIGKAIGSKWIALERKKRKFVLK